ncbi:MAG TPA: hypothetical protein VM434_11780, partial [Beijerinckiaceae bacterium]|nr:hypothetical protein [Beijerinckiaceae bacterium]
SPAVAPIAPAVPWSPEAAARREPVAALVPPPPAPTTQAAGIPADCAYCDRPTRARPVGLAKVGPRGIEQRLQCGCPLARCWNRITVRGGER